MNTILKFHFDGDDVEILVCTNEISKDLRDRIGDAILSYVDTVEDWEYEELVGDVLRSFGLDYRFISPITYII